jgi:hypothetical protein
MGTSKVVLILLFGFLSTSSGVKYRKSRRFLSNTKYHHEELELFYNGRFKHHVSSCTFGFTARGRWEQFGDTLFLHTDNERVRPGSAGDYSDRYVKFMFQGDSALRNIWMSNTESWFPLLVRSD